MKWRYCSSEVSSVRETIKKGGVYPSQSVKPRQGFQSTKVLLVKSLMCAAEEWRLIPLVELMKVFRVSHKLRSDLWTPMKGLGQSRMMELTRKYLIPSGKTLNLTTGCQRWQGLQPGWVLVMIKPVFTQDSPRIQAVFVSLLRFFSRLVPNKPVPFGLEASEQFLLVLVKLKQAV